MSILTVLRCMAMKNVLDKLNGEPVPDNTISYIDIEVDRYTNQLVNNIKNADAKSN